MHKSDVIDVECDTPEAETALQAMFDGQIPATPTYKSARGKHRLFRRPEGLPKKAKLEIDGIEFRIGNGKGALSVVPPSKHSNGAQYKWLDGLSVHNIEPAELPAEIIDRLIAPAKPEPVRDAVAEGTRHDVLFRLACSMRSHGATQETIDRTIMVDNQLRCDPPLPESEVQQIVKSAVGYDPGFVTADQRNSLINLISLTPPVLGAAAYHGFSGEVIRAVDGYTEATDAAILIHLLCATAAMIGPGPHVYAGGNQPARINGTVVGPTSTARKGTAYSIVNQIFRRTSVGLTALWKQQCVRGLSSGEGLIYAVSDKQYTDENGKRITERAEKRLFVLEPEFSKVLSHCRREGNVLSHVMRESFDSGDLQTLTRNNPLRADGAHICIVGHITPEELRKRLNEIDMANGFANRFLWFYVESYRVLPDAPRIPDNLIKQLGRKLSLIIKVAKNRGHIEQNEESRSVWRSVYPYLRASNPGLQGSMIARGESIVMRLSLIYALLDKADCIGRKHMEATLAVWQYNEESVRLIFSEKMGDSLQDKLLELLGKGPMTKKKFHSHMNKPAKSPLKNGGQTNVLNVSRSEAPLAFKTWLTVLASENIELSQFVARQRFGRTDG